MLCTLCKQINFRKAFPFRETVEHHKTYADLALSVSQGCDFCKVAHTAVIDTYSEELTLSYQDIIQLQMEQDNVERNRHSNYRTSFFFKVQKLDLDDQFAPIRSGVFGAEYNRRCADDGSIPLCEVYTCISLWTEYGMCSLLGSWRKLAKSNVDSPAMWDTNVIGRSVSQKVNIMLGLGWIQECLKTHPACMRPGPSQLPSRVIDVGADGASKTLRLISRPGKLDQYVTLSHCWGGGKTLCTNSKNYGEHLRNIPFESLPRTFQDAVTATRQLGFRYLWIDSLCIIQDSAADWEQECAKMLQIYQDSIVTIAGPAATNSDTGFLDRQPRVENPTYTFSYELPNNQGIGQVIVSYGGHQKGQGSAPAPDPYSAISKRAWILQERLLSPQILYFGSRQIYWECSTNLRYESVHFPLVDDFQTRGEVVKASFDSRRDKSWWLGYWYRILRTYFDTELTFPSDKLPAISGLAKKMQSLLGYHYLAGLWREDLARGLSWYRPSTVGNDIPHVLEYRAPSWSWASQDGPLRHYGLNVNTMFLSSEFDIIDAHVEKKGQDLFGKVQSGYLKIRGKIRTGIVRKLPHQFRQGEYDFYLCQGCLETSRIGEYFPDNPEMLRQLPNFESGWREPYESPAQHKSLFLLLSVGSYDKWAALAIEPVQGNPNHFRRVGFVSADGPRDETFKSWFENSESMILDII